MRSAARPGTRLTVAAILSPAAALIAFASPGCAADPPAARAAYRAGQRAYSGAPPTIPHPVAALQRQDCLSCHEDGLRLPDGSLAASTPHPEWVACRQCHVEQHADTGPGTAFASNGFKGMQEPARGERAYPGAPPTVPHRLDSRRNCLGCHDTMGGSPIATPHPDRVNCLQCHAPSQPRAAPWRASTFVSGSTP